MMPTIIIQGGRVGFSNAAGMHRDVLGDFKALQPTFIFSVPRLFEIAMGIFDDMVKQAISAGNTEGWARRRTIERFRSADGPFGARLCMMSAGSAPVTPQLLTWMKEVYSTTHGGSAEVRRSEATVDA